MCSMLVVNVSRSKPLLLNGSWFMNAYFFRFQRNLLNCNLRLVELGQVVTGEDESLDTILCDRSNSDDTSR